MDYAYAYYERDDAPPDYQERFAHGLYTGFCLEYTFASTLPQSEKEVAQRRENRKRFWLTEAILFLFDWGRMR
jgi:hypothetical protein